MIKPAKERKQPQRKNMRKGQEHSKGSMGSLHCTMRIISLVSFLRFLIAWDREF